MPATELQATIDTLNAKKYARVSVRSEPNPTELTEAEKLLIETYQPQHTLIVYGSLAPGRPNHSKVEMIKGVWRQGTVSGKLVSQGWGADLGFNGFVPDGGTGQIHIPVHVLFSDELADYLSFLDEFEGDGYQRILSSFTLENGDIGVGNIYALNESFV